MPIKLKDLIQVSSGKPLYKIVVSKKAPMQNVPPPPSFPMTYGMASNWVEEQAPGVRVMYNIEPANMVKESLDSKAFQEKKTYMNSLADKICNEIDYIKKIAKEKYGIE